MTIKYENQSRQELLDQLLDRIENQPVGFVLIIEVAPAGRKDGSCYGAANIQIVRLGSGWLAFRELSDYHESGWEIGVQMDAVDAAFAYKEQLAEYHLASKEEEDG